MSYVIKRICMEMSVESVYPIAEDIPSGLLFMLGQLFGILMIVLYPYFGTKIEPDTYVYNTIQKCNTANSSDTLAVIDYDNPLYFQSGSFVLVSIFFIVFYKCPYSRLKIEREKLVEEILNTTTRQPNLTYY
jgi:hypothetical protein